MADLAPAPDLDRPRVRARARLLDAGHELCREGGFITCTVDDICDRAGVSRATFYKHFGSKDGLLTALTAQHVEWYVQRFRIITIDHFRSTETIMDWLQSFVAEYRSLNDMVQLHRLRHSIDATFAENQAMRRRVIEIMGLRVPELGLFRSDGAVVAEREAEFLMWLYQWEQLCLNLAFAPQSLDGERCLELAARNTLALLRPDVPGGPGERA